ncbi:MAG: serine hydrolase [Ginsengibacter sp.]
MKYAFVLRHGLASASHAAGKRRTASDPPEQDFTVDHRYNPASVTKVITAVAILQLLDKNNLTIQDKIWTYLPKHWLIPNSIKQISFRQLLRHTSGIRFDPGNTLDNIRTSIEHGINLADTAIGCPPGAVNCYLNINYAICRVLIAYLDGYTPNTIPYNNSIEEAVISRRFTDYMQKNIFDKLSISNVSCAPPANGGTLFYPFPTGTYNGTNYGDWTLIGGPAGIQLSTNELSTFLLQLRISTILLSKNMLQIMDDNSLGWDVPPPGSSWKVDGDECNSKGGWFPGDATHGQLNSCIMDFKNGLQITLVSNGMVNIFGAISNAYKKSWTK